MGERPSFLGRIYENAARSLFWVVQFNRICYTLRKNKLIRGNDMDAVISVIGTIPGTILGWVLNSLSTGGELKTYVSSWNDSFQYNKIGSMIPSKSKEQLSVIY